MTKLELEERILEIVDQASEMPRGDLQGVIEALVMRIEREATQ